MGKKAAQMPPNQFLRRARLQRGWTQKMVAERIGAPNDVMVTRWESGKAFPRAYYIERLCQLFEQQASDLGLLKEPHSVIASQYLPRGQSRPGKPGDRLSPASRQNVPLLSSLPMVGREVDTRTLQGLYQMVQQGQTQAVLVQGEAGMGKTQLASTFLRWAAAQGATVLQGRAFEMGGRLPYQPLTHALGRHLEEEPAPAALLSATWLSELSRILPELRDRYPYLPAVVGDETTARIRLFEAVTRLLQALCEGAVVVLFLDDVQWADDASLDVLHYAGQRWSELGTPLLLLATRSEALATNNPLTRWLAGLHAALPVTELTLGPLTQDETLHLLGALGTNHTRNPGDLDRLADLGQWLFRETRGQPFYLVETLRVLLEQQILTLQQSSEAEELKFDLASLEAAQQQGVLPPGVRRLILSQLGHLTPAGRSLVRGSAILGQGFSFDVLCRVADLEEEEALAALDEVLGHGLLREESPEDGRGQHPSVGSYIFGHDKMREVIATEMGEAQRRLLHRRALSVLEARDRPAAELAYHALAAGLTEQTVRLSLTAGEEAVRLLANVEASLQYSQAVEALEHLPETADTRDLRVETILKLVQVSWMTVSVEHTLERLAEAEELAQRLPDPDRMRLAHIHYWRGVVYGTRSAMRQAREYAERVLVEAQELGDEELVALASLQLSRVLTLQGQYGPIEGLLTPIIPVLERAARWLDWTYALGYLGSALAARGHIAAGVAQGQRAVERARRADEMKSGRGVMARHFLSIIHLFSGNYLQMLEENDQVVKEAQQLQDWLLVYWGYGFRSWAEGRLGRHEEAMESMARSQTASQRLGGQIMGQDILEAVTAELLLADVPDESALYRVEEALARAEATIELSREEVGGILGEGLAQRVRGQALAKLERWEEAERHLAESWQILLSGENLLEAARTQVAWGLLCRDRGEMASARGHFEQAAAQFETSGLTREVESVWSYLAKMG